MAIKIKKRVGKSLRRVSLFGKPFEIPRIVEDASGTFVVDKLFSAHYVKRNSMKVKYERTYNVAQTHLPNDISSNFTIVDPTGLVTQEGKQILSIRELSEKLADEYRKNATSNWMESMTSDKLYIAEPTINPRAFFKENRDEWERILLCWLTEGLDKDQRLIDGFKSAVLPFYGAPDYWQPYNPNQIWFTNSGTGKSFFNMIGGNVSNVDVSVAGLFGANVDDYKKQRKGMLDGSGMMLFDEVEQLTRAEYSRQIVLTLLGYMEQGRVERTLKVHVSCEGTKTIIFSSNPTSDDALRSFVELHKILQGDSDPTRLGRRIGLFLMGNDFKRVKIKQPIVSLRRPIKTILDISLLLNKSKYIKLLRKNMTWIDDVKENYKDYENTIRSMALGCPDEMTRKFINGLSMSHHKLRMASVLIALLDHFDDFALGKSISVIQENIKESRETIMERLCQANIKSVQNLVITDGEIARSEDSVKKLRERFPELSVRNIAKLTGYHHNTVARILREDDEGGGKS